MRVSSGWSILIAYSLVWMLQPLSQASAAPPKPNSYSTTLAFPNLTFSQPLDFQVSPANKGRFFVAQRAGVIVSFQANREATEKDVFLDITDRVRSVGNEEGLLGFAFHPNYSSNGYIYVNYTSGTPLKTVISRFGTKESNPLEANPNSETIILEYSQPFSNHNGGQLAFGPDGYLYISSGDGGSGGDPQGNGQNLSTLLGKILRIDVDRAAGELNYSTPSTNPFLHKSGALPEIFAYGLRNPWRMSFDAKTGKLWAGDVGQDAREEIDIIVRGRNYGWSSREGNKCYSPSSGCKKHGLVGPIRDYSHTFGESVTGGYVYRGNKLPEIKSYYVYADFVSGRVWALRPKSKNRPARNVQLTKSGLNISAFGQSVGKELYLLSYSDGKIYRLKRR